jgi:nucleoside-diphosphate-sugar epimerase
MPAVQAGKVLVTGANGYIAAWLVKKLLDQGYSVRGTVRSAAKGAHLTKIFAEYGNRFEQVVVEDITKVSTNYTMNCFYDLTGDYVVRMVRLIKQCKE